MTDFALINGLTLHYALDGITDGQPIVLIHSLGTDLRLWDGMIPKLSRYRVLRFDLRGHGLSDDASESFSIHDLASDVRELLDLRQIDTAVIVGISVGGLIAMNFALRYSERVRSLILCDTAPKIGTSTMWNDRIAAVRQNGLAPIADAIVARWFTPDFAARQPAIHHAYRNLVTRTSSAGYTGMCEVLRDTDLTAEIGNIQAKTLLICGALDVSTPPEGMRELAQAIPDARFVEIADAAHLPPVEHPDTMANLMIRFIEWAQTSDNRYEQGMKVRRSILGAAHVDRSIENQTDFDADFQRYITENAWGTIWTRPGLDRHTRFLITLAMMAALGRERELRLYIRATRNTGVTQDEIKEVLMQVAIYAGVPAANSAFAVAKQVFAEMDAEQLKDNSHG